MFAGNLPGAVFELQPVAAALAGSAHVRDLDPNLRKCELSIKTM